MLIENRCIAFKEQAIRERAYFIWEGNGGPAGKALEHWRKAEKEIEYEYPRSWAEVVLEQGTDWPLCPRADNRDGGAMAAETVAHRNSRERPPKLVARHARVREPIEARISSRGGLAPVADRATVALRQWALSCPERLLYGTQSRIAGMHCDGKA